MTKATIDRDTRSFAAIDDKPKLGLGVRETIETSRRESIRSFVPKLQLTRSDGSTAEATDEQRTRLAPAMAKSLGSMFAKSNQGKLDPVAPKIADHLKRAGFLPTRASATSTTFAPAAARPGYVVAQLDNNGIRRVAPGLISEVVPGIADQIRSVADSVRLVGVPVLVVLVTVNPESEADHVDAQ